MFDKIKGWFGSEFPNDVNGDVFRRMKESGMDFSKVYNVDFEHLFPDEEAARAMEKAAAKLGYKVEVSPYDSTEKWNCRVVVPMKLTHEGVTTMENTLGKIADGHGGYSDGWGALQE